jgi:hypothetical protein
MTVLHGEMTGAEVDVLRLPLRKKLTAISDLPGHIVAFRGSLGRLATVGQAPLPLDVYRWFLATLSPFPVFQQYTLLFTVANGAIAQQTFEAYAAYVLPQLHNILAHSNPRPFAGNLEGLEYGADEDMMTGDLLYPNPLYPNPLYPTINSAQHLYPTPPLYPTQQHLYPTPGAYLPPPPGLGFAPHPMANAPYSHNYPMANAMYPYPPAVAPSPAPASSDKAGTRQKGKNKKGSKTAPKEKTGTLNTTLPRTSLLRPSKTHFYCHHHGWVTTHGWPSGHGGHHGAPCMFMVSHPSEFTPAMLAARTPDAVPNHPGSANVQRTNVCPLPLCSPCTISPRHVYPLQTLPPSHHVP